jgi:murein DD-endopeptidase MepM/ murein hydrolase activator NlpD
MSRPLTVLLAIVAIVIVLPVIVLFALSSHSSVQFDPVPKMIGSATPLKLIVANPHGVRHVRVLIEQGGVSTQVYENKIPATRLLFFRKHEAPREFYFNAGSRTDGRARIVAEVTSNDFRGATDTAIADVDVVTKPPMVVADGFQHYVNQGGSELVVFTPSGFWTESGVRVGKYTFRSWPKPGSSTERFSVFAFPWDTPADTVPVVYARNPAGTEARTQFWFRLFPKTWRKRDFDLTDSMMERLVNQIDPSGTGDLLSRFLKINGDMRRANNQTLSDQRAKSADHWTWNTPFVQLSNSKVEASFADIRTYVYKGKKVDEQTHLGFDLSVTAHVPVVAANDGKVAFADTLGIYGNCIVVDHGYGVQSIYGHLSQIEVKPGDTVKKGQEMGKSGSTGLALGDHLHFTMQVDGVQVNPVEWWDGHWLQDRIWSKVPPPAR